jgi:LuxR family transcriptional regulator, maltose regulon positive regulatory protein
MGLAAVGQPPSMNRDIVMIPVESAPSLVDSKLHAPRLSAQHVPRLRLIERLDKHRDRPLTLVCAPAGSGKSTLLSEWVSAMSTPTAWVSLDEGDNELIVFLTYVLAAMRSMFPTRRFATPDLMQALALPPLEALATSLSNDLDQIESDFLLVLDDYHVITNPQIDQLLFHLLQHPPRKIHLAIATRADPTWPLATFRARGQLTELRFADLQFTAEESAAFLRNALDDAIDQDLITVLHAESEGWAAGLQLISLIMASDDGERPRLSDALGTSEDIGSFLLAEVFTRQSPVTQNRLLQLSILGRFCAPLCEAVCNHAVTADEPAAWGKQFLTDLEHRNLFVIALDAHREFFRFHHLFRRFLAERLLEHFDPEQIAALHQRASGWFAAQGLVEEALDHALAAGDISAAANLVAKHRHDLYDREQFARLTRWLRLLPTEVKEHNPELLLAEARIATMNWRFTEAAVLLDHADKALADAPLDETQSEIAAGELAVLRGVLDLWDGNPKRLVSGLQRALEQLPRSASHLRGLAHMGIAAGYWQLGDSSKAKAYVAEQVATTSFHLPLYATLLQTQSFFHGLDGDLTNLEQTANRLLRVSEELELPDQAALAHYFLGTVHYARNNLAAAESHLTLAVAARFTMRLLWWCQAAGLLALTSQAFNQPAQAQAILKDAHALILERHAVRILPNWGAFQAELDRRQGHLAEASAWAAQVEPGPLVWSLVEIDPHLVQARVLLSQERTPGFVNAAAAIADVRSYCERIPNARLLMEVEALEALLNDQQGQHEVALQGLTRLVIAAEPQGRVRLFVDLGDPMFQLLRELAVRRVAPQAISPILNAFRAGYGDSVVPQQRSLIDPLSKRELEILALLAGRESNKEIATQLFISPATAKRHTINIYRKLDVNDRREAVSRAQELDLLPAG